MLRNRVCYSAIPKLLENASELTEKCKCVGLATTKVNATECRISNNEDLKVRNLSNNALRTFIEDAKIIKFLKNEQSFRRSPEKQYATTENTKNDEKCIPQCEINEVPQNRDCMYRLRSLEMTKYYFCPFCKKDLCLYCSHFKQSPINFQYNKKSSYKYKKNHIVHSNITNTFSKRLAWNQLVNTLKMSDGEKMKNLLIKCNEEIKSSDNKKVELPEVFRKSNQYETEERDKYFGDCYHNKEYHKMGTFSYFIVEDYMQKFRLPQPSSKKN